MKTLIELVNENGHKLVRHNEAKDGYKYISVFDYSERHGGTLDSFKFYNNYYVEVK